MQLDVQELGQGDGFYVIPPSTQDVTKGIAPISSFNETGWLTQQEDAFLESTVSNRRLLTYLYTRDPIRIRYPRGARGSYDDFIANRAGELERAHQTLRRIMRKTPYTMTGGQRAFVILDDKDLPLGSIKIGTRVVLGYKLILLNPKLDVGKFRTLAELVFPSPIKVVPIGKHHYVMDEDHVFTITGFERRFLEEHPSHGTPYHLDMLRMVMTEDVSPAFIESQRRMTEDRIHLMIDGEEKKRARVGKQNWMREDDEGSTVEPVDWSEFEVFGRMLGTMSPSATSFSKETLTALYRVSMRKPNVLTNLLFSVHLHILSLKRVVDAFNIQNPEDITYGNLEDKLMQAVGTISSELDTYFMDDASVSKEAFSLFLTVDSEHIGRMRTKSEELGSMVAFDNYVVGYTFTNSISDIVAASPDNVVLVLRLPPRMPVLVIPEHTGASKQHRAVILPRETVYTVESVDSTVISRNPTTYRKVFTLRYSRTDEPPTRESKAARQPWGSSLNETHSLLVEPEVRSRVWRDMMLM